jgi:nucleoside-diphosphate-sugar epimerase
MNLTSLLILAVLSSSTQGFSSPVPQLTKTIHGSSLSTGSSGTALFASIEMDRRSALTSAAASLVAGAAATFVASMAPEQVLAQEPKTVVVAGATGQTGRRVLERLAAQPGWTVIGGVRNVDKATKSLSESSTVIRGAMVQQVNSIDTSKLNLKHLDVVQDSVEDLKNTLQGADSLVIAVGFVPGNPLKMNEEAHKVDNLGTIKLIDAAKAAGLKKVVLVSSILTDGRSWGQEQSPGFVITNAFGKVLDEKIVAENYLRASGLDYTIVRPGGLKAQPRKSSSCMPTVVRPFPYPLT